jgi:hypothetical protein
MLASEVGLYGVQIAACGFANEDVLSVVKSDFDFFRAMSFTLVVDCF